MSTPILGFKPALLIIQHAAQNEHYRRAVTQQQGYTEWVELRDQAIHARGALPKVHPPASPQTADEFPEWLEAVAHAEADERARTAKETALTAFIAQCEANIQGAVMLVDPLLKCLSGEMDELMGQVDEVAARLEGAHTPNEVIAAGRADVWNELLSLRHRYDDIRQAQDWVMSGEEQHTHARSRYLDDPLATDCAIANLDDIFPAWKNPRTEVMTTSWNTPDPRPWPADPVEQLVWLSASDAKVWVPTLRQLDALGRARWDRMHPLHSKNNRKKTVLLNESR